MPTTDGRTPDYQRPAELESLLGYFADRLGPVELAEIAQLPLCDEPILYIMGCARSGTTLVYQYLAHTGLFAYPSNFLSRFYYAPYLGAQLQQMLFDCDFRGEITGGDMAPRFESQLGKTQGPLAPHEFWYFWRRFYCFGDEQQPTEAELDAADGAGFIRELRAMQTAFGRPLVLKGMILNWHLPYLATLYDNSYFLIVERDVADNADSLLRARREFAGTEEAWYSFKPPGYRDALRLSPEQQVAWQVTATNDAIRRGAEAIDARRVMRVSYEDFCANPLQLIDNIRRCCGITAQPSTNLPQQFEIRRRTDRATWQPVVHSVQPLISRQNESRRSA